MHTCTEFITVEQAMQYLATSQGNRSIRHAWVRVLANMMMRGEFYHTHQGIAFDADGCLKDGHHRLMAIVMSGCPQTMQVTRGLSPQSHLATDWGRPRTLSDSMALTGDEWVTPRVLAVARLWIALVHGAGADRVGNNLVVREFVKDHESVLLWIKDISSHGIYGHACVMTMMAIGYERGYAEELTAWYAVFRTGVASEHWHTSAVSLREWWLRNPTGGGHTARVRLCHRVFGSMRAWIDRRPLAKSYEASKIEWLMKS